MNVKDRIKSRLRHLRKYVGGGTRLNLEDMAAQESLFNVLRFASFGELAWAKDRIKENRIRIKTKTESDGDEVSEIHVGISGDSKIAGRAEIKTIVNGTHTEKIFTVRLRNGEAGKRYQVRVDGQRVGFLRFNKLGKGLFELTSRRNADASKQMGDDFPELKVGSRIRIGRMLSGRVGETLVRAKSLGDPPTNGSNPSGGDSGSSTSSSESEIEMFAANGLRGWAEYEIEPEDGITERNFTVKVKNASVGESFRITVGGVDIGSITAGSDGEGEVEFTNRPNDSDEILLPNNFPMIQVGTKVSIGDSLMGEFGAFTNGDDDGGGDDSDDDGGDSAGMEFERKARLTGSETIEGRVEYEEEMEHGGIERKLKISVKGIAANQTYVLRVGDVALGELMTNGRGRGRLELTNMPDDSTELLLPESLPEITKGTRVSLGDDFFGFFGKAHLSDDSHSSMAPSSRLAPDLLESTDRGALASF